MQFLGKQNRDGSFSISVKAHELVDAGWVDFYDEPSGRGYQRFETMRETRARQIEDYFGRCVQEDQVPSLFEMTASARCRDKGEVRVSFDPLDDDQRLGIVNVQAASQPWMSMVDGGTRLRGVERALEAKLISAETYFDVRLYRGLSVAEEIAKFLLINENQKRVRTDLSLRVVQRALDEGALTDAQVSALKTVVPNSDQWRFEASRVTGRLNNEPDSPFRNLIQMPGEKPGGKPVAMQAFWTSLKHFLDDDDLVARVGGLKEIRSETDFWVKVLKNFWGAVADANPESHEEPKTNVLWGSIGVNGCHRALAEIVRSEFRADQIDLSRNRFAAMVEGTWISDYAFWFTRKGNQLSEYPGEKGEATQMTGNSGYIRLSASLESQWRANLHAAGSHQTINL